jgi:nucleotide-binding universal stress UspA family protein
MFKLILVPTDGSEFSSKAIKEAVEYAATFKSKIIGISVAVPYPYSALVADGDSQSINPEDYEAHMRDLAEANLEVLKNAASAVKVECETIVATGSRPHEEIVKAAIAKRCDAIFMASHGRKGLSKFLLGSETQKVLSGSSIPVLVLR